MIDLARFYGLIIRVVVFFILLFAVSNKGAGAEDLKNISGSWICKTKCSCTPASPNRYTSISPKGTSRNECGDESKITFSRNKISASDWKLTGVLTKDKAAINWQGGMKWERLPSNTSELEKRMAYWESQTFYCARAKARHFPSKEGNRSKLDKLGRQECDDGDSVMFNALLCRGGDSRGCFAIKASQDKDGRFWRSPLKRELRPAEPANQLKGGQTTFSGDHAAGLMLYFGHTEDRKAFKSWIKFIDGNGRCQTWCGGMPPQTPRYCKNDRCAMRVGDCQTLLLLGAKLKEAVPFCSPDIVTPIPTVRNLAVRLRKTYDETIGKLKVKPPHLKFLRDNFDQALKKYEEAVEGIEKLRTQLYAEIVRLQLTAQLDKAIAARINARGFSRHNALVQIMMLEDWGQGYKFVRKEAGRVAKQEPLNPFFQYVGNLDPKRRQMLKDILNECPAEDEDPHNLRIQWSWERDTAKKEWVDRMYWDCLFIARMYFEPPRPTLPKSTNERKLRELLGQKLTELAGLLQNVEKLIQHVRDLIKKPVGTAVKIVEDEVKKQAKEAEDLIRNPKKTVEKKGKDLCRKAGFKKC